MNDDELEEIEAEEAKMPNLYGDFVDGGLSTPVFGSANENAMDVSGQPAPAASGLPKGFVINGGAPKLPADFKINQEPARVPSARDQYVKAAGQLIAHATRAARDLANKGLDAISQGGNPDPFGPKVGGAEATSQLQKDLKLPEVDSPGIVERLSKSADDAVKQFKIPTSQEEEAHNPTIAALGITRPLRAYQAVIDSMLPEVAALRPWFELKQRPLTEKIDAVINRAKIAAKSAEVAIAPVEDPAKVGGDMGIFDPRPMTGRKVTYFDLALRTAAETANQLAIGTAEGLRAMLNPVDLLSAEVAGRGIGAGVRGAARLGGEAIARTAPEMGLRAQLSPVTALKETATARLSKPLDQWTPMDQAHHVVQGMTNSALKGVQEAMGASAEAMAAAAKAADRAGYEALFRRLNGLPESGLPTNPLAGAAPSRWPGSQNQGLLDGPGEAVLPPVPRHVPTAPAEVAAQTIGAAAVGPEVAAFAREYPTLYSVTQGYIVPPSFGPQIESMLLELSERGIPPGSAADMIAAGIATGKASFVQLSGLNDALLGASLTEQGADPRTIPMHAADIAEAAQRPGETLVVQAMEAQDEQAAVRARAMATAEVWEEAHRAITEADGKAAPPAAATVAKSGPAAPLGPETPAAELPPRSEVLTQAAEAGVPLEIAADVHRNEALAAMESGTLDTAIAAEYAENGDVSFDPAELEAESAPMPDAAKHPGVMTPEEFAKSFPGAPPEVHKILQQRLEEEEIAARQAAYRETLEGVGATAQPVLDFLRKRPISRDAIEALGLTGDFQNYFRRGITTSKGGAKVDDAVTSLVEAGILPENATPSDMLDAIDNEDRKGSRKEATASMVGEDKPAYGGGELDLFDNAGNVNPAIAASPEEAAAAAEARSVSQSADSETQGAGLSLVFHGKAYPIASLDEAADMWTKVRTAAMAEGMGSKDLDANPKVLDSKGQEIAEISWNGTIKKAAPKGRGKDDVGQELWYNRRNFVGKGLSWDEVKDLNATLKASEITKVKIWPRPDYEELVAGGMHPFTAHLVKQAYDAIATKPDTYNAPTDAEMKLYVEEVQRVKEDVFKWAKDLGAQRELLGKLSEGGATSGDIMGMITSSSKALLDALYPATAIGAYSSSRWRGDNDNAARARLVGNKFIKAIEFDYYSAQAAVKALKQGWPAPQEAWQKRFEVHQLPAGTHMRRDGKDVTLTEPEFQIVTKGGRGWRQIVGDGYKTREEAEAAAKALAAKKSGVDQSRAVVENPTRSGPPLRPAGMNVKPQDLMDKFGFRGVNFGNYTKPEERQDFTNHAYDALLDLAEMLNVPPKALSLNGALGIAYGAQGKGGKRAAAAHFVPGVNEINLTKDGGAGALAHEWGHALDHYFAVQAGETYAKSATPYLTSFALESNKLEGLRPEIKKAFVALHKAMTERPETPAEYAERQQANIAKSVKAIDSWLKWFRDHIEKGPTDAKTPRKDAVKANELKQFDLIADALRAGRAGNGVEKVGAALHSFVTPMVGEIRRLYKDVMGRVPPQDYLMGLDGNAMRLRMLHEVKKADETKTEVMVNTTYLKEAKGLDQAKSGKTYWTTPTEMFARAFESYALDQLANGARRNDFLTSPQGTPEAYKTMGGDWYPRGMEREKINAAFDAIFKEVKTRETEKGTMIYEDRPKYGTSAPAFYHKLQRDIQAKMPNTASVEQVRALLREQKSDEVEWSGIEEYLAGKTKVEKGALLEFLRANQLEIKEVLKGGTEGDTRAGEIRVHLDQIPRDLERLGYEIEEDPGGMPGEVSLFKNGDASKMPLERGEVPDEVASLAEQYANLVVEKQERDAGIVGEDDAKFGDYTLSGGKNYRELLLTMPAKQMDEGAAAEQYYSAFIQKGGEPDWKDLPKDQRKAIAENMADVGRRAPSTAEFQSSHFDEPNVLAHVRFNDRVDADGAEVLFIEEVQSDWHQKGRREGYSGDVQELPKEAVLYEFDNSTGHHYQYVWSKESGRSGSIGAPGSTETEARASAIRNESRGVVPNAPLKKTWHEFALKRILRYAAENGYDKIAWTTGTQQADRYTLSHQVDAINALRYEDGTFSIRAKPKGSQHWNVVAQNAKESELSDIVGKDMAAKISAQAKGEVEYSGLDLQIGGEGMKGFYDKMLPAFLSKFGKKYGAEVGETKISTATEFEVKTDEGQTVMFRSREAASNWLDEHDTAGRVNEIGSNQETVHAMPITPALREAALTEGFSMFDRGAKGAGAARGEYVVEGQGKTGPSAGGEQSPSGQSGTSSPSGKASESSVARGASEIKPPSAEELQIAFNFEGKDLEQYVAKIADQLEAVRKEFPNLKAANQAAEDLRKRGVVSYVGKTVRGAVDAAELFAAFRHPQLEHFQILLVKSGKVVAHPTITSGVVDLALIPLAFKNEIVRMIQETGADAYYFAHNHPSGNPTPSQEDRIATEQMVAQFKVGNVAQGTKATFKGHVVTDDIEFMLIAPGGDVRSYPYRKKTPKPNYRPDKTAVTSEQSAIDIVAREFGDKSRMGLLSLDARNQLLAFDHIPVEEAAKRILEATRSAKASAIILCLDRPQFEKFKEAALELPRQLLDVIVFDGDTPHSIHLETGRVPFKGIQSAHPLPEYVTRVAEEEPKFSAPEPAAEEKPRYMRKEGMDARDLGAAIAEKGLKIGSDVTARIPFDGFKKGDKLKVVGIDQAGVRLLVQSQGEVGTRVAVTRPENLVETYRRPAARLAVQAAMKAEAKSGQPSQPIKKTVAEQSGMTDAADEDTVSQRIALREALRKEAAGARTAASETSRRFRSEIRQLIEQYDVAAEAAAEAAEKSGLKEGLRKESVGAARGAKDAQKTAKIQARWEEATRGKIAAMVREALPAAERATFLSLVAKAKTPADIITAFFAIEERVDNIHRKEVLGEIKVLVDRIMRSPSFPLKFKQRIQERLADVRIENWTSKTLDKIAADAAFIEEVKATGEDIIVPRALLDRIGKLAKKPLNELPVSELETVREFLLEAYHAGADLRKWINDQREADKMWALHQLALGPEKMRGIRSKMATEGVIRPRLSPELEWAKKVKNSFLKKLDAAQRARMVLSPMQMVFEIIDGRENGPAKRLIFEPIQSKFGDFLVDVHEGYLAQRDAMMTKWGDIPIEESERVGVVIQSAQEGGREKLHQLGLDDIRIDAIVNRTDPVYKKPGQVERENEMVAFLQKAIQYKTDEMVEVEAAVHNKAVKLVSDYYPMLTDYELPEASVQQMTAESFSGYRRETEAKFLKERVANAKQQIVLDPFKALDDHMPKKLWFIHMARVLKDINDFVKTEEFSAAAGDVGGKLVNQWLDAVARMGTVEGARRMRWLSRLRRGLGAAAIAFNPGSALIQPSALGDGASAIGGKYVSRGISLLSEPAWQSVFDELAPKLKYRGEGRNLYTDVMPGTRLGRMEKIGGAPIKFGDNMSARVIFGGAYALWHDLHKVPMDPQKPNTEAARFAQSRVDLSQSSPHLIDLPLAMSGGRLTGNVDYDRALAQFQLFLMGRQSHIIDDILGKDWKRGNRGEAAQRLMWIMGAMAYESGMSITLGLIAAWAAGDDKAEKDSFWKKMGKNMARSAISSFIPILPSAVQSILYGNDILPAMSVLSKGVKGAYAVASGTVKGQKFKVAKGLVDTLSAAAAYKGIPGSLVAGRMLRRAIPEDKKDRKPRESDL